MSITYVISVLRRKSGNGISKLFPPLPSVAIINCTIPFDMIHDASRYRKREGGILESYQTSDISRKY